MKTEKELPYKIPEIGHGYLIKGTYNRPKVRNPEECYHILKLVWDENSLDLFESFKVILVDSCMVCIAVYHASTGRYGECIVEPRQIFANALNYHASGLVLANNHPGDSLEPIKSDFDITGQIVNVGSILGIQVYDHLTLSSKGYLSFAKENIMPKPLQF